MAFHAVRYSKGLAQRIELQSNPDRHRNGQVTARTEEASPRLRTDPTDSIDSAALPAIPPPTEENRARAWGLRTLSVIFWETTCLLAALTAIRVVYYYEYKILWGKGAVPIIAIFTEGIIGYS